MGHGNRALETQRCLLWNESFRGCDLCECGGKQDISTVNDDRRLMWVGGYFV